MPKPTYDTARAAYSSVLGTGFTDQHVNGLISALAGQPASVSIFRDAVISLPPLSMHDGLIRIDSGRKQQTNTSEFWGEGASGKIELGESGTIYKKIAFTINDDLENSIKEIFLEAWIQTVLGMDSTFGKNVSQIRHIYRDISIVRGWEKLDECILYITMDPIATKMEAYLESFGRPTIDDVKPQFIELGEILEHFGTEYNFRHRDLHQGNVMFDESSSVVLIDFGRCCFTFNYSFADSANFSMDIYGGELPEALLEESTDDEACFSYDLIIFVSSLLENYSETMSYGLNKLLNEMATSNSGENLYSYAVGLGRKVNPRAPDPASWQCYPGKFIKWSPKMIAALLDCPTLEPDGFITKLDSVEEADYPKPTPRKRGGTKKLRSRKRKNNTFRR